MQRYHNGELVDMTAEEIEALAAMQPAPLHREIPKDVVMARVEERGLLDEMLTIMYAPTQEARRALARWNMPKWPNVHHDDPEVIAMLDLAGATAEDKAYILA